jgi:hypothetical protein
MREPPGALTVVTLVQHSYTLPDDYTVYKHCLSPESAVGIAIGYGLEDRGVEVRVPVKIKNILFSTSSRPALGSTQTPIQWVPWALSSGVKRPVREADHLSPASWDVKKMWLYTSTPPYAFMA